MTSPESIATAAVQRGTFNFADAIRGRNYGTKEVPVVLDDRIPLRILELRERLNGSEVKGIPVALGEDAERINQELNEAEAEAVAARYIVKLRGISETRRDELQTQARETYPMDYEEREVPLTGEKRKIPVDSPDRDKLFTNLLWAESIVSVTSPAGDVAENLDLETVSLFRAEAPTAAKFHIMLAIEELRVASDWYEGLTNADFTPKP